MPRRSKRLRVVLVDDHPLIRAGVRSCLKPLRSFEVVGEAGDGREAVNQVRRLRPDLVLMDLVMPGLDGFEAIVALRREVPSVRVLVLTRYHDSHYVAQAVRAGAHGYLTKTVPPAELVSALRRVGHGGTFFSSETAHAFLEAELRGGTRGQPARLLSAREREVLVLVADGLSNKQIGAKLGVGVRTIETHRERIMRKLDIHSVAGITRFAIAQGWVHVR